MFNLSLGHYEILELLGAGGMGEVYRARDPRLDRDVAIKVLSEEGGRDAGRLERFRQEAKAIAALEHPGICTIYEIGEADDGRLFIAMALCPGEALSKRIDRGPLPIDEAIEIALQVAAGLRQAHEQGIVHRDIKPANVIVSDDGGVKIVDFGIARDSRTSRLTETGTTLGTLAYMPPEQVQGKGVDQRADIWALGTILFEMLTGSLPFPAETEGDLIYSIFSRSPLRLTELRPAAPFALELMVNKALAKNAADRYSSAAALVCDLEQLREQDQPTSAGGPAGMPVEPDTRSLAVLPFTNITKDPADDWLSTGITETLTVDLIKIRRLRIIDQQKVHRVIGTSSAADLGQEELVKIGAELDARWLFSGAFQKAGNAVRITAELFDAVGRSPVESMKLDGTMQEIFSLQDHHVAELSRTVDLEVSEADLRRIEKPETTDLKAWECYAKARRLLNELKHRRIAEAELYLRQAVEIDPDYAMAYSGLGMLHTTRYIGAADPRELELAITYLLRAIELDPELADPHLWLAYAYARLNRFEEALDAGQTAVRMEPENPLSHYFLGAALWLRGIAEYRLEAWPHAVEHLKKARALAPRLQTAHQVLGDLYLRHGQYEQASTCLTRAAELEESGKSEPVQFLGGVTLLGILALRRQLWKEAQGHFSRALLLLENADHVYQPFFAALTCCGQADLAFHDGHHDEALHLYRLAGETVADDARSLCIGWVLIRARLGMARCFHLLGMRREEIEALRQAQELLQHRDGFDFSANWETGEAELNYHIASYHALAGHHEAALEHLGRAVDLGWRELPRLRAESSFDPLRSEPQYLEIAARLEKIPPLP